MIESTHDRICQIVLYIFVTMDKSGSTCICDHLTVQCTVASLLSCLSLINVYSCFVRGFLCVSVDLRPYHGCTNVNKYIGYHWSLRSLVRLQRFLWMEQRFLWMDIPYNVYLCIIWLWSQKNFVHKKQEFSLEDYIQTNLPTVLTLNYST